MLNDLFFVEFFLLINLFFFFNTINLLTLWYLSGFYLLFLGFFLFLNDSDIFVGFLWVIDLGVGLIFFIFILYFTNFLHQKTNFDISNRFFLFFFLFFLFFFLFTWIAQNPTKNNYNIYLKSNWFFYISWYNYYLFFNSLNITELQLLRELYFYNNSFEFYVINFILFYGLISSILFSFLLKKVFLYLNYHQLKKLNFLSNINSIFFIRNQNFLNQQNTNAGTRVWLKKKINLNDL